MLTPKTGVAAVPSLPIAADVMGDIACNPSPVERCQGQEGAQAGRRMPGLSPGKPLAPLWGAPLPSDASGEPSAGRCAFQAPASTRDRTIAPTTAPV